MNKVPVNDTIIYALARAVDDSQTERRDLTWSSKSGQFVKPLFSVSAFPQNLWD